MESQKQEDPNPTTQLENNQDQLVDGGKDKKNAKAEREKKKAERLAAR